MFIAAQIEAINSGSETVSIDLIKRVYNNRFKPLHRIINALRSNNKRIIEQYEDLYPKAFEELKVDPILSRIDEIKAQQHAQQERSLGIMDNHKSTKKNAEALLDSVSEKSRPLPEEIL